MQFKADAPARQAEQTPATASAKGKPKTVEQILTPPRGVDYTPIWLAVGASFLVFHFFLWALYALFSKFKLHPDAGGRLGLNAQQEARKAFLAAWVWALLQLPLMAIFALVLEANQYNLRAQILGRVPGAEQTFNNMMAIIYAAGFWGMLAALVAASILLPRVRKDLFHLNR